MALKAIEIHVRQGIEVETRLSKQVSDSSLTLRYVIEGVIGEVKVKKAIAINAESLLTVGKAERIAVEREKVADEAAALYAMLHDDDDLIEAT